MVGVSGGEGGGRAEAGFGAAENIQISRHVTKGEKTSRKQGSQTSHAVLRFMSNMIHPIRVLQDPGACPDPPREHGEPKPETRPCISRHRGGRGVPAALPPGRALKERL